jgi:hypothetical protein
VVAGVGLWRAIKARNADAWPVAWWIGCLGMVPMFRFRWLSGEGLLPVVWLGGLGFDAIAHRLVAVAVRRPLAAGVLLMAAVSSTPVLEHDGSRWRCRWPAAGWIQVARASPPQPAWAEPLLSAPLMLELARLVERQTRPGEILWSNMAHPAGWIAVLARRATSTAMFDEIRPATPSDDPLRAAQVLVWFKLAPMSPAESDALERIRSDPTLRVVADHGLAVLLRRAGGGARSQEARRVIPLWAAGGLLGLGLALIWRDVRRRGQAGSATV